MGTLACAAHGSFCDGGVRRHGLLAPFVAFRMRAAESFQFDHHFADYFDLDEVLFLFCIRVVVFCYRHRKVAW
jgi:hypothetical protein